MNSRIICSSICSLGVAAAAIVGYPLNYAYDLERKPECHPSSRQTSIIFIIVSCPLPLLRSIFIFFFFSIANIGIAHNDEECRCRCEKRKMYIILSVVESKKNNIDIRVAGKNLLSRCVAAPFMPNTNGVVIILISMLDVSRPLLFYVPQSVRQNNCPDLTDCSSISIDIRIACA